MAVANGGKYTQANYVPTPDQFFDRDLKELKPRANMVLAVVIRKTLGYIDEETGKPKMKDVISISQFDEALSISRRTIWEGIEDIKTAGRVKVDYICAKCRNRNVQIMKCKDLERKVTLYKCADCGHRETPLIEFALNMTDEVKEFFTTRGYNGNDSNGSDGGYAKSATGYANSARGGYAESAYTRNNKRETDRHIESNVDTKMVRGFVTLIHKRYKTPNPPNESVVRRLLEWCVPHGGLAYAKARLMEMPPDLKHTNPVNFLWGRCREFPKWQAIREGRVPEVSAEDQACAEAYTCMLVFAGFRNGDKSKEEAGIALRRCLKLYEDYADEIEVATKIERSQVVRELESLEAGGI